MGLRGLVVLIMLLAAVAVVPLPSRAVNPTISNVAWTPWVPAHGEYVTVEADIWSPGGPPTATTLWCVVPPFTCIPVPMNDPNSDGRYTSDPIYAANPPYTGAGFNVTVSDPGGNISFTNEIYVQFASTITVDATLSPASATPAQRVNVSGTALYETNVSVPAKFTPVQLRLEGGPTWSTITDGLGAFASSFTAPTSVGTYALNVTITNRTISGSKERYLAVANAPAPDLAITAGSLRFTPNQPTAGQIVTLFVSVENRGTAAAGAFSVRFNVSGSGGPAFSRTLSIGGLAEGAQVDLNTTWTAAEGGWTLGAFVDSGSRIVELSETNNAANVSLGVAANPPSGPSVTLMVGVALMGVGVAAAVALAYRWRTRRKLGP